MPTSCFSRVLSWVKSFPCSNTPPEGRQERNLTGDQRSYSYDRWSAFKAFSHLSTASFGLDQKCQITRGCVLVFLLVLVPFHTSLYGLVQLSWWNETKPLETKVMREYWQQSLATCILTLFDLSEFKTGNLTKSHTSKQDEEQRGLVWCSGSSSVCRETSTVV